MRQVEGNTVTSGLIVEPDFFFLMLEHTIVVASGDTGTPSLSGVVT